MTGWADTWMLSTSAPHPNCMLEWMKWTMTADVQAEVADYYGAGTSNGGLRRPAQASGQGLRQGIGRAGRHRAYGYCGDAEFLDRSPVEDAAGRLR